MIRIVEEGKLPAPQPQYRVRCGFPMCHCVFEFSDEDTTTDRSLFPWAKRGDRSVECPKCKATYQEEAWEKIPAQTQT